MDPSASTSVVSHRSTCRKLVAFSLLLWSMQVYLQTDMFDSSAAAGAGCLCRQQQAMNIGDMEKRQLVYYIVNRSLVHQHLPSSAHHTLDTNVTLLTSHYVTITLTDIRHTPLHKLGGANLRTIVSTDTHLYACPYVDHFNGSYDVICSLYDHSHHCHDVTITLVYQDFGAYRWDGVMINRTILTTRLCSGKRNVDDDELCCLNKYTGWYRRNKHSTWQWLSSGVSQQSLSDMQQTTNCFRHPSHTLYLIADSHLRRIYDYWKYTVSQPSSLTELVHISYMLSEAQIPGFNDWSILPAKRGFAENVMKLSHLLTELERWRTNYVQNYRQQTLESSFNKRPVFQIQSKTTKVIVIISFGLWDVAFRNISQVVAYAMPALSHWLHTIREDLISDRVRLIILTPPAQGENMNFSNPQHPDNRTDLRNNALVAAVVSLLRDAVRDHVTHERVMHNVHIVDYFAMTFARRGESYDGVHYVAPFPQYITDDVVRSSLGFDVERFLKYEICKDVLSLIK